MNQTKENKGNDKNIYKTITFILIGIIILGGVIFTFNYFQKSKFEEGIIYGQENTIKIILSEINQKGFIDIPVYNETYRLVSAGLIPLAQEEILIGILKSIQEKGYVEIQDDTGSLILIPYIDPNNQTEEFIE